jgi:pimeloyl-ACP methyl ester carboxylesterase
MDTLTTTTVSPGVTFYPGAYCYPGYGYPLLQLQHPTWFKSEFFERTSKDLVTVDEYGDFIYRRIIKQKSPRVYIGHSAGAVALWLALAKLAEVGDVERVSAAILMHPANIGPGKTRLGIRYNTSRDPWLSMRQFGYFSYHTYQAIVNSNQDVRKRLKKAFGEAGKPVPPIRFKDESWSFVMSALDGSASPESKFPRDRVLVIKGGRDDVTTPQMVDETVRNIGPVTVKYSGKLDHSTPLRDRKAIVLGAALAHFNYRLP